MTREQIESLSDSELIEAVAGQVMPVAAPDPTRCAVCGWPLANYRRDGCVVGDCAMRPVPVKPVWSPLTDWNHTMQVVTAMYKRGWTDEVIGDLFEFVDSSGYGHQDGVFMRRNGNEQRAILRAALMTVQKGWTQ